jgi:hypothetical protein
MMGRKIDSAEHRVGVTSSLNTSMSPVPTESPLSTLERKKKVTVADNAKTGARKALLQWVKNNITELVSSSTFI